MDDNYNEHNEEVNPEIQEPPPAPASEAKPPPKVRKQLPQKGVDLFWDKVRTWYIIGL